MKKYFFLAIACLSLNACLAGVAVTGAEAAKTIAQERSVGNRIDDNGIILRINDKFAQKDFDNIYTGVTTRIFEGRVMLTGAVTKTEYRDEAEKLTWQVGGIKEVINEIQVAPNGPLDYSNDLYLQKAVKAKLLITKTIPSANYEIDVVNSVVYILGIAKTDLERRQVIEIARRVGGVKEVVSHIILGNDPRRVAPAPSAS